MVSLFAYVRHSAKNQDRIPIPQLRSIQDARLTNSTERASAYRSDLYSSKAKERLAALLDPSRLSEV